MNNIFNIKTSIEKDYDSIYESIIIESNNFCNILESLEILKSNNIIFEMKRVTNQHSLIKKIQAIWQKVVLFFKKIKTELIDKKVKIAEKKLNNLLDEIKTSDKTGISLADLNMTVSSYYNGSIEELDDFVDNITNIDKKLSEAFDSDNEDTLNEAIKDFNIPDIPEIKASIHQISNKQRNIVDELIYYIKQDIESSNKYIQDTLKLINTQQSNLSNRIKSHNLSYKQYSCLTKMIQIHNIELQVYNKAIMLYLKCIYMNFQTVTKISNHLKFK